MGGPHMDEADHAEIWDRFETGQSMTEIGAAIGRTLTTVRSYIYRHGSRRPIPKSEVKPWSPYRLSLGEREEISRGLANGDSVRSISLKIGRSPSTVSREINRNGGRNRYRAATADEATRLRASRRRPSSLQTNVALRELVTD